MAAMFYEYKGSSGSYIYIDKCTNYKYIPRLDYTVKILYVESGNRVLGVSWRCDGNSVLFIVHCCLQVRGATPPAKKDRGGGILYLGL